MANEDLIDYFIVKYQAVGTTDDSIEDEDDIPEKVDINGWITFEANLRKGRGIQYLSGQPPFELFPLRRRVRVENGRLDHNGTGYVKLEAAGPHGTPSDWNWGVSFDLGTPYGKLKIDPFNIPAVPGSTVDLTSVAPTGAATGTPITLGPYPVAIRVSGSDLVIDLSNGDSLPPVHVQALDDLDTAVNAAAASAAQALGYRNGAQTAASAADDYRAAALVIYNNTVGLHNAALNYRNDAQAAASAASISASNAAGSASTASSKATEATNSAGASNTKAGEAATSASNAAASATTATTKAGEASTSATNAANSATAANNAKTAAEAARDVALTGNVNDGAVTAVKLAANAVTTAKILDANVTLGKLAADSVDSSKIVNGSIVAGDINAAAAILKTQLAAGVQTTLGLADTASQTYAGLAKVVDWYGTQSAYDALPTATKTAAGFDARIF